MLQEVILGEEYTDSISGFKGKATARCTYLYGCVRVVLESKSTKNSFPVECWFDEQRLIGKIANRNEGPRSIPTSRDPK